MISSCDKPRTMSRQLVWNRAWNNEKCFSALRITEKPDQVKLKMIFDDYKDADIFRGDDGENNMGKLKSMISRVQAGKGRLIITRKQTDMFNYAPAGYCGARTIGRAYGFGMVSLPSIVRNTVFQQSHVNFDVKNCYLTVLSQLLRPDNDALPFVMEYLNSRDDILSEFKTRYGVERDVMKKAVIIGLVSYPDVSESLSTGSTILGGQIKSTPFFKGYMKDVEKMWNVCKEKYPLFCKMVKRYRESQEKRTMMEGQTLMYLAQDVEYTIIRTIIDEDVGRGDVVYLYDGLLIPHTMIKSSYPEFALKMSDKIKTRFGLHVIFKVEDIPMNETFKVCIPENSNGYERWSVRFENDWFQCRDPVGYVRIKPDGKFQIHKKDAFSMATKDENKEHVDRWLSNPHKRKYETYMCIAPPLEAPEGVLNTWVGLRSENLEPVPDNEVAEKTLRFKNHILRLVGNVPDYAEYVWKTIAFKAQNPGLVTRVLPVFQSTQGTGKDCFFDYIEKIFGRHLVCRASKWDDVFGSRNMLLQGKAWLFVSECNYKDNEKYMSEWKNVVTGTTLKIKILYEDERFETSHVSVMAATNDFTAFSPTEDDRRLCIFQSDSTFANKAEYFDPLYEELEDDVVIRSLYQELINIDLKDFNPSSGRPITTVFQNLVVSKPRHAERFLVKSMPLWIGNATEYPSVDFKMMGCVLQVSSMAFYGAWEQYAEENGIGQGSKNKDGAFCRKLLDEFTPLLDAFRADTNSSKKAVYDYRSHGLRYKMFEIPAFKKWESEKWEPYYQGLLEEEDQAHEDVASSKSMGYKVYHVVDDRNPYVVKQGGVVAFSTDSLEEVNKFLGEAYVEKRGDKEFLVHQRINLSIELEEEYKGEHGKTKLEMKYPWYKKSRVT